MNTVKKRLWSADEKCEICDQVAISGVLVMPVARRSAMNAKQIQTWLRDPWCEPADSGPDDSVEVSFWRVEVTVSGVLVDEVPPNPAPAALCATRVDITPSDPRRVLVKGPTALHSVFGLIEGLAL
jgi:transposase